MFETKTDPVIDLTETSPEPSPPRKRTRESNPSPPPLPLSPGSPEPEPLASPKIPVLVWYRDKLTQRMLHPEQITLFISRGSPNYYAESLFDYMHSPESNVPTPLLHCRTSGKAFADLMNLTFVDDHVMHAQVPLDIYHIIMDAIAQLGYTKVESWLKHQDNTLLSEDQSTALHRRMQAIKKPLRKIFQQGFNFDNAIIL